MKAPTMRLVQATVPGGLQKLGWGARSVVSKSEALIPPQNAHAWMKEVNLHEGQDRSVHITKATRVLP